MIENFVQHIYVKSEKYIIFDIGSRDCAQSIEFYKHFPNSHIYSFECNPNTLEICKKNIEPYSDRITLIEGAICDYDGEITFYPINQKKTITSWIDGNPGASSIFRSNGNYTIEKYVQDEIKVRCHRLDTIMDKYSIEHVDIIWMDLQGAELLALKGLGAHLKMVKYIYTEVSHKEMYSGQVMFPELNNFITSQNFSIINKLTLQGWQEDVIYKKNTDLFKYEKKVFSQNGEDGITLEIINRLNIKNGFYVEFGTQDASECNTRILRETLGWNGLLMDGFYENTNINLRKEFITRENIINLFIKYKVPQKFDLLSIDLDLNDFYVLYEILQKYEMDIIILEYNSYFRPHEDAIVKYDPKSTWDYTNYFGASLLSYTKLLNKFGYTLVYTETKGVNAFFVKNEHNHKFEFHGEINLLYNEAKYGWGPRGSHGEDKKLREYLKFDDIVESFDIVIPFGPSDKHIINQQIEYTKKNIIGYRNIYIISYDPNIHIDGCQTIQESLFPFSLQTVSMIHGKSGRNGWYLQQLLKIYALIIIPDILERCLIIDSDTIFLKPTIFVNDNKCLYNFGSEYHLPYFRHMSELDNNLVRMDISKSGICHHMMLEKKYIMEIIHKIEEKHNDKFYNVFLKMVSESDKSHSGASEYEIYFNYMLKYHNDKIKIRKLNWNNVKNIDLNSDYDYVSCHYYLR